MEDRQVSEGLLVERIINGDKDAQAAWWNRDHKALFQFIRSHLSVGTVEDCEDIAQESFARALVNIQRGKYQYQGVPLLAYLQKIANNQICDFVERCRVRGHEVPIYTDSGDVIDEVHQITSENDEIENVIEKVDREPQLQLLQEQMTTLPTIDQMILSLLYSDEMNATSIGESLGMKPGTVRQRAKRAKDTLVKAMPIAREIRTGSR